MPSSQSERRSITDMNARGQYKRLLKSVHYAFSGDNRAIKLARIQLKQEFLKNKHVSDAATLSNLWKDVEDVDNMLRFHIVQGKRSSKGSYGKYHGSE